MAGGRRASQSSDLSPQPHPAAQRWQVELDWGLWPQTWEWSSSEAKEGFRISERCGQEWAELQKAWTVTRGEG